MRKGQIGSIDLFIAIFIFLILLSVLVGMWNLYSTRLNEGIEYEKIRLLAFHISDTFVKTPGYPSAWENSPSSAEAIGLASSGRVLSSAKVDAFIAMNYSAAKQKIKAEGYDFKFRIKDLSNNVLLASGANITGGTAIAVERYVKYENEKAIMEFAVWK
ncbi:MAG: hypothetical protein QME12_06975 [Nanoarchaeota archaeon]|nr:hypothetical protein [Nanoarchaeota archaeon]